MKKTGLIKSGAVLTAVAGVGLGLPAAESTMPKVGAKAPWVASKDQHGQPWKLANALKKNAVLLYFYPKDDTPGCTQQACGWRDRVDDLRAEGVEVVGVSFDSQDSHQRFSAKHKLNFTLLTDPDGKIADAFGVRAPGRAMARRVSFLIGRDGKIAHITDSPNPDIHLREMKDAVAKLKPR